MIEFLFARAARGGEWNWRAISESTESKPCGVKLFGRGYVAAATPPVPENPARNDGGAHGSRACEMAVAFEGRARRARQCPAGDAAQMPSALRRNLETSRYFGGFQKFRRCRPYHLAPRRAFFTACTGFAPPRWDFDSAVETFRIKVRNR